MSRSLIDRRSCHAQVFAPPARPGRRPWRAGLAAAVVLLAGGLLRPDAAHAGGGDVDAIAAALAAWIEAEHGLAAARPLPTVAFAPPERLEAMRRHGSAAVPAALHGDILAVYDDRRRTVYLLDGWTAASTEDLSILVHELVHHAQNLAGRRFACPQEREAEAFAVQAGWLALAGTDLEAAFGVDPLTLLVRTSCPP